MEYDLERAGKTLTKGNLLHRPSTMWRYMELLPLAKEENIISLGEGCTPLVTERAATWASLLRLAGQGWLRSDEEVVLFNTSHALKYLPWKVKEVPIVKSYAEWVQTEVTA